MQAGKLRQTITIQKRPNTQDTAGLKSSPWIDVVTLPGNVLDLVGRELVQASAIVAEATTQIELRGYTSWRNDVRPEFRAICEGRTFDIRDVRNPDGRSRQLLLTCVEIW